MRVRRFRFVISICLALFLIIAVFMTKMSQINYLKNCIEVTTVKKVTSESLMLKKTCYVENMIEKDGTMTFAWNDEDVNLILSVEDLVTIETSNDTFPAEIIDVKEADGIWNYTVRTELANVAEIMKQQDGVTICVEYKGPLRTNVIPSSCIKDDGGIYKVAVVYEKPKVWGTEHYIHYEIVRFYEMNEEKCALINVPTGGEIVSESEGPLFEGTKVVIKE